MEASDSLNSSLTVRRSTISQCPKHWKQPAKRSPGGAGSSAARQLLTGAAC